GDDYSDETYIQHFRLILDAVREQYPLDIVLRNRRGDLQGRTIMPAYLEYSEKDDKFRLIGTGNRLGSTVNLGRIVSCTRCEQPRAVTPGKRNPARPRSVTFELTDERKALERVLFHFAHFKKQAERLDGNRYRITVFYDKDDETEVVIRILSFGPMLRVTAPQHFVELLKQRLIEQKNCAP
ncbi:MAG: WYL domain-containing protein, partial [Hominenteromicrobium sp.]